eukprot:TRINITY_DN896_c0_g1_i1.p1 TRINITY_DN896_c0_g1~~TRINITY_DN896_c0_g1_i1.p1  ORF type:complete len:543 (+),score=77.37 TRINITY_DN896_c0_g1_i1:173-1801(+)
MSGVCYSPQNVQATFRSFPKPTQLGLKSYKKGVQNRGLVQNLQSSGLILGRGNVYKKTDKNMVGIVSCEGVSTYEAPFTPDVEYDTETTVQTPREPEDGYELLRFYPRSNVVLEFLRTKFATPDDSYDVVAAMAYLDEKFQIFSKIKRIQGRNRKINIIFELLIEDVQKKMDELSLSDKITVMKCLSLGNNIVFSNKGIQFLEGRVLFVSLLQDVLRQEDSISAEDISKVAISISNFKQYDDTTKILSVFDIAKNRFTQASNHDKILLLDSFRLLRCWDPEVKQAVEQGILDGSFKGESEEEIKSIFSYLGTMECSDKSISETLANNYLELPTRVSDEIKAMIIYNLAWLGADPSFIQNFVDQTLGVLTGEEQKNFVMRSYLGNLRRTQYLLLPTGVQIVFPPGIRQNVEEDLQGSHLRQKIYPNISSKAVTAYLQDRFADCDVQSRPTMGTDMRTDMSIIKGDTKVAIEVRLPTSYFLNQPQKLMGYTKAAFQSMENRGWKVVCVKSDKFMADDDYKQSIADQIRDIVDSETETESLWKEM